MNNSINWFLLRIKSRDITATASVDYTKVDTSLTFLPSDVLPKTQNVFISTDNKIESDETFELLLETSTDQVTVGDNAITITIIDDDGKAGYNHILILW